MNFNWHKVVNMFFTFKFTDYVLIAPSNSSNLCFLSFFMFSLRNFTFGFVFSILVHFLFDSFPLIFYYFFHSFSYLLKIGTFIKKYSQPRTALTGARPQIRSHKKIKELSTSAIPFFQMLSHVQIYLQNHLKRF